MPAKYIGNFQFIILEKIRFNNAKQRTKYIGNFQFISYELNRTSAIRLTNHDAHVTTSALWPLWA